MTLKSLEVLGRVGDNSRDSGIMASSHSNRSLILAFQKLIIFSPPTNRKTPKSIKTEDSELLISLN